MELLNYTIDELERWFLMMFRVSSMLMVMPVFGYNSIPVTARVAVAFFVTSVLFPLHPEMQLTLAPGVLEFFGVILREVFIGLSIGLVTVFIFTGVQFAGHVMGHSMGFGMINAIDPFSEEHMPVLGQLLTMFTLVLFLMMNGHHFLLQAVDESFVRIPIGTGALSDEAIWGFARLSGDIFNVGIKVAAPVLITILVSEFALGMMARTVPQMNVWIIGFPLKIMAGLLTLSIALPMVVYVFGKIFRGWEGDVIDFLRAMVG
ncbi:flagellar type III secretion system protein FliR [bacterium]|nr:flagellar type III secretion system protein FliR [bacterium]